MAEQGLSAAVAFGAGLLSFFSPCILPMIPVYMCSLAGENVWAVQGKVPVPRLLIGRAVAFTIGFTVVFMILGLAAGTLGNLLWDYRELVLRVGGLIIIIFGLNMLGIIRIPLLFREKRITHRLTSFSLARSFLLGSLFSLGWTPCIGPILASILFMAGGVGSPVKGMFLLFLYAVGLGIPFVLTAVFISRFSLSSPKFVKFLPYFNYFAGSLLVIMGLLLLTGAFYKLSNFFSNIV